MDYPCRDCKRKEVLNTICVNQIECPKFNSYIDELIKKGIDKNIGGQSFVNCELCSGSMMRVKETKLIETYYIEKVEGGQHLACSTNKTNSETSVNFITKCNKCGHVNTDLIKRSIPIL